MRLFPGIFTTLAAQALLVSVVPGGALVLFLYQTSAFQVEARDRDRLEGFTLAAAQAARAGMPLDQLVNDLDPNRLGGRVSLVNPEGQLIAGSGSAPVLERPVKVDGRTIAIARLTQRATLTDADRRYLATQYIGIGVIVLAMFTAMMLAAYIFTRRWTKPQLELYRLSREVVHGNHEIDFEEEGPPETVATMRNLRRVASQFNRLESARRTWLVSISDELKRPAESMGEHFIELCKIEPPLKPELLAGIEEDTHRLIHMAEDLSAIALADLGRLPVNFAQVDPRALIHNAIWTHKKRAESQQVRLETSTLPEYTILVKWDGGRIEQLFGALIDNSLRYTSQNGRIVLGLESSRDAWRLIIDDNAPGIDVMLAQSLFEPFYRSSDGAGDSAAASGLGLATARAIVEAHHGRIEASRSPIGGLRVTVILPANPPTV